MFGLALKRGYMKRKLFKTMIAAGAVAMICACSDDSGSSSPTVVDTPCANVTVTADAWLFDSGNGYLTIYSDGTVKDAAGNAYGTFAEGTITDAAGNIVAQNIDVAGLTLCPANAFVDPNTGNVERYSSASTGDQDPNAGNQGQNLNSSADNGNGSENQNPNSSAGAVDPTSSTGTEPVVSSSSIVVNKSPLSEMSLEGYPVASYKNILGNGTSGWNTRYWDACKPHCSWIEGTLGQTDTTSQESYEAGMTTTRNCNIHDVEVPTFTLGHAVQQYWMGYEGTSSACDVGEAGVFTCTDMAPIAVNDTLAYAYVAGSPELTSCGKCFHLQYDGHFKDEMETNKPKETHLALKGKHIIVMASNIGHDVKVGQFDLMVPGGGPGNFDALTTQVKKGADFNWGAKYGGFLTYCQEKLGYDKGLKDFQDCIHERCDAAFKDSGFDNLYRGCIWFADWYMAADNPTYQWEEVECPQYLKDHYLTTINKTKSNNYAWHTDWSTYNGEELETIECTDKGCNCTAELAAKGACKL